MHPIITNKSRLSRFCGHLARQVRLSGLALLRPLSLPFWRVRARLGGRGIAPYGIERHIRCLETKKQRLKPQVKRVVLFRFFSNCF